ncbi:MAG: hypothetical protein F6K28_60890, partial [Microcoleus sp. SIO2G3]|nr:hypothetical protein [Microcoleus sp. SIO2G3]
MATTAVSLVIQGNASSAIAATRQLQGATAALSSEVTKQRQSVRALQSAEAVRAAQARLQFAQQEKRMRAEEAFMRGTPAAILAAQKATERVTAAQAQLAITSRQSMDAQQGVGDAVETAAETGVKGFVGLNAAMLVVGGTVTALVVGFGKLKESIGGALG